MCDRLFLHNLSVSEGRKSHMIFKWRNKLGKTGVKVLCMPGCRNLSLSSTSERKVWGALLRICQHSHDHAKKSRKNEKRRTLTETVTMFKMIGAIVCDRISFLPMYYNNRLWGWPGISVKKRHCTVFQVLCSHALDRTYWTRVRLSTFACWWPSAFLQRQVVFSILPFLQKDSRKG